MMFGGEKRRRDRVYTHLVVQMTNGKQHFYGYIENISAGGLGLVSMDYIEPHTKLICSFFLGDEERLNPSGTVIYIRKSVDIVYRYGIRFDAIGRWERRLIEEFTGRGKAVC